jgi:type II secretory pathway pseudopilin PulG
MRRRTQSSGAGFTLVELLVSGMISSAMGIAIFAFLNAGMILSAKNVSLNLTSNQMRDSLDRVEQVLQQGDTNPELIDTTGAVVASGAAAGVRVDRYMGGPYVVAIAGAVAGSSSLTLTRSTDALALPPLPRLGDVIRMDGAPATPRARIGSAPSAPVAAGTARESITCPLAAPLTTTADPATVIITAKLVRQVAFIVMPNGSKYELRYYDSIETTSNLNDPTKYVIISDQIANQGTDLTPFSLVSVSGETFVNFSLRVRSSKYDNRLRPMQGGDEYNTFSRVDSFLRPKVNP